LTIEHENEADAYLTDLLKVPENRSMSEIEARAGKLVPDTRLRDYFITTGREMLAGTQMTNAPKLKEGDEVIFTFTGGKWKVLVKYQGGGKSFRFAPYDSFDEAVADVKKHVEA
jgi:hypothetical protein